MRQLTDGRWGNRPGGDIWSRDRALTEQLGPVGDWSVKGEAVSTANERDGPLFCILYSIRKRELSGVAVYRELRRGRQNMQKRDWLVACHTAN